MTKPTAYLIAVSTALLGTVATLAAEDEIPLDAADAVDETDDAGAIEPVADVGGKLFGLFTVDVRAGTIYRAFGDVTVGAGSYAPGLSAYPALLGSSSTTLPSGIGSASGSSSHVYDDGYNRPSAPTPGTGLTWFWGYQKASQISGDTISFHATGGSSSTVSISDSTSGGAWSDDGTDSFGTYLETNLLYKVPDSPVSVGPQFAFSWNGFDSSNSTSTFRRSIFRQNRSVAVTDTYSLGGIIAPGAPYAGGSTGPGPVIPNTPSSRSVSRSNTGTASAVLWNQVKQELDVDVYTFSFGGHASWDFGKATVFASAGLTANVVDASSQRRETLYSRTGGSTSTVQTWNDSWSDTDVLWGTYLQAGASIKCPFGWTLGGFLRYDWTQSLSGQVGPSRIDVDLDSFSAGVFAGFSF